MEVSKAKSPSLKIVDSSWEIFAIATSRKRTPDCELTAGFSGAAGLLGEGPSPEQPPSANDAVRAIGTPNGAPALGVEKRRAARKSARTVMCGDVIENDIHFQYLHVRTVKTDKTMHFECPLGRAQTARRPAPRIAQSDSGKAR